MPKTKYHYNPKTLQFEHYKEGLAKKIKRVAYVLCSGVVFSAIIIFLSFKYINSPKEKILKREISNMQLNYKILNNRLERMNKVLEDLEQRDDNVYRVIFEAEPISDEVRTAGFGGINRYEKLEGYKYSDLIKDITKKVDRISKQMVVQSRSYDKIWQMVKSKEKMLASIPAILPINIEDIDHLSSGYGYRIDPFLKTSRFHAGMDFTSGIGTEIYATGNGTVIRADANSSGYGNHVRINHGYGYITLYGHMTKYVVHPGQKVKRGQLIGYVGSTGRSTGPHLHYEVRKNNEPIDPVNFYFTDITPEEYEAILKLARQPGQSFD